MTSRISIVVGKGDRDFERAVGPDDRHLHAGAATSTSAVAIAWWRVVAQRLTMSVP